MSSISKLTEEVVINRFNPSAIQRLALDTLEEITEGKVTIVDPTNPFVFLMESSAVNSSAVMTQHEALIKQTYSSMAVTQDDLYLHMSDVDFLNIFATPSKATFTLMFSVGELIAKGVETDLEGIKKITIPKHTEFSVGEYTFTLQYPIDITVYSDGRILVTHNTESLSPLVTITDNVIPTGRVTLQGESYISFDLEVDQFQMESVYEQISLSSGLDVTHSFTNKFYTVRAYMETSSGWREILTTHTDKIIDSTRVTAVLRVVDNYVNIQIPQFYIDAGMVSGTVRFDIHTTLGKIKANLDSFIINSFTVKWKNHDLGESIDNYGLPLTNFSSMAVFSASAIDGGSDGLSFEALRDRVITNSLGAPQQPITSAQLESRLNISGYKLIKDVDNITDRVFIASRKLPNHNLSPIGSSISTLVSANNEIVNKHGVYNNGDRITISPEALFLESGSGLELLSPLDIATLESLDPQSLLMDIISNRYLQLPFHYVLDTDESYFDVRPYYLNNPSVNSVLLLEQNNNLNSSITVDKVRIEKTENGYTLFASTMSSEDLKALDPIYLTSGLSFAPSGQSTKVYIESSGYEVGASGELIFSYHLDSSFDVNSQDELFFTNFKSYSIDNRSYNTGLVSDFELSFIIRGVDINTGNIPNADSPFFITNNDRFISVTKLNIEFGSLVKGLWSRARSVLDVNDYLKYENDVLGAYEENVYERDASGALVVSLDLDGNITYNLLHSAGDPILDTEGNVIVEHKAGDLVLDSNGSPIIANKGEIVRDMDLFLIDGSFRFSTNETDIEYLNLIPSTIMGWLNTDIKQYKEWLLEQTDLMLYPERTTGKGKFLVLDAEETTLDLEQRFTVSVYLTRDNFVNTETRDSISDLIITTINKHLDGTRVSINEIVSEITSISGESIVGLSIEGLGGDSNYTTVTTVDPVDRLSIKKRLVLDLDGVFSIVEDIDVLFIKHET